MYVSIFFTITHKHYNSNCQASKLMVSLHSSSRKIFFPIKAVRFIWVACSLGIDARGTENPPKTFIASFSRLKTSTTRNNYPPKTNISLENPWLEDEISYWNGTFFGGHAIFFGG